MISINKYIFYEICNKNIDLYNEYMNDVRIDYYYIIRDLENAYTIEDIRFNVHKVLSVLSNLQVLNDFVYICKLILLLEKKPTEINKYHSYKEYLITFDHNRHFE